MLAPTPIKPSYQTAAKFAIVKVAHPKDFGPSNPSYWTMGLLAAIQQTHQKTGA